MKIAITGHRDLKTVDHATVVDRVVRFLDDGVTDVYMGGAVGVDTLVLETLLAQPKRPRLVTVVPCRVEDQSVMIRDLIRRSDEVVELCVPITRQDGWQAYRVRNQFLVDRGVDRLVAFHNGSTDSGTWQTMRYARQIGRIVEVVGIS